MTTSPTTAGPGKPPRTSSSRDVLIGAAAAVLAVGLLGYAILTIGKQMTTSGMQGTIVEKIFAPEPATEITVGAAGVKKRRVRGEFQFRVHVKDENKDYIVWVDEVVYNAKNVGDRYHFLKPRPGGGRPAGEENTRNLKGRKSTEPAE